MLSTELVCKGNQRIVVTVTKIASKKTAVARMAITAAAPNYSREVGEHQITGVSLSHARASQIGAEHSVGHLSVGHRVGEQDAGPNLPWDTERSEDMNLRNISLSQACATTPSPTSQFTPVSRSFSANCSSTVVHPGIAPVN